MADGRSAEGAAGRRSARPGWRSWWWWRSRWRRIQRGARLHHRAALQDPGLLLTFLFGLIAIWQVFESAEPPWLEAWLEHLGASSLWILVPAILVTIAALYGLLQFCGWLSARSLPPEDYARLAISGRRAPEIFETIAVQANALCRSFVKGARTVDPLFRRLDLEVPDGVVPEGSRQEVADRLVGVWRQPKPPQDPALSWSSRLRLQAVHAARRVRRRAVRRSALTWGDIEAERIIARTKRLRKRQDSLLRRLDALKWTAADELDVPPRRLCDHILQFSPATFRAGVEKYHQNWQEMRDLERRLGRVDLPRFVGLMRQNRRLEQECRTLMDRQRKLLRFADLHEDIHRLAATRSTSGSLQAYARALTALARDSSTRLGSRQRRGRSLLRELPTLDERFRFLYRKQKAHPGFELHALLVEVLHTFAEEDLVAAPFCRSVVDAQIAALEAIADDRRKRPLAPLDAPETWSKRLTALTELQTYMNRAIALSRDTMTRAFGEFLRSWGTPAHPDAKLFLVTSGYSKTVRELVLRTLGAGATEWPAEPCVFLLLTGEVEEWETRLMRWEFRPLLSRATATHPSKPRTKHRRLCRLAVGDEEMLACLGRKGDRALFLLGVESIDAEGKMAHPRAAVEAVRRAVSALRASRVETRVIVAAERYKLNPRRFVETAFFAEQFERPGFYGLDMVDHVVSDVASVGSRSPWLRRRLLRVADWTYYAGKIAGLEKSIELIRRYGVMWRGAHDRNGARIANVRHLRPGDTLHFVYRRSGRARYIFKATIDRPRASVPGVPAVGRVGGEAADELARAGYEPSTGGSMDVIHLLDLQETDGWPDVEPPQGQTTLRSGAPRPL